MQNTADAPHLTVAISIAISAAGVGLHSRSMAEPQFHCPRHAHLQAWPVNHTPLCSRGRAPCMCMQSPTRNLSCLSGDCWEKSNTCITHSNNGASAQRVQMCVTCCQADKRASRAALAGWLAGWQVGRQAQGRHPGELRQHYKFELPLVCSACKPAACKRTSFECPP